MIAHAVSYVPALRARVLTPTQVYRAESEFARPKNATRSRNSVFGGSLSTSRFPTSAAVGSMMPSRPNTSASATRLPHGGQSGAAFRKEPSVSPGPGDYVKERGFDGTGRLRASKSVPACA